MSDLISIIIPVKNGEKYIEETILAIKKQNMNVEIILVDDGSTDNTAEIAENLGCTLITHKTSKGPVMAKVKEFFSPELSEEEKQRIKIKSEPYYGLFTGAILIRESVFDKIGLFNESVTAGEIIDWQSKMDKNNLKIKKLDIVSTNRRIHSSNFGKTQQKTEFRDYATLLRARMKR